MLTFLIIVLTGVLIYIICMITSMIEERRKKNKPREEHVLWAEILPEYKGRNCEIIVKDPLVYIDVMHSVKGRLLDADDEWIMLECEEKKKTIKKVLRISNISSVKEII